MPLRDYKCVACPEVGRMLVTGGEAVTGGEVGFPCPACGDVLRWTVPRSRVLMFRPVTLRDLGPEPVHFETKKDLIQACKDRGATSPMDDGMIT